MFRSPLPDTGAQKSKNSLSAFSHFDKARFSIVLITIVLTLVLAWFGFVVKQKVLKVEKEWLEYSKEATLISHTLNRIQEGFGYGGVIHDFKNYILRKDKSLIPKIEKGLADTLSAIDDYPLDGIFRDLDDRMYIENLKKVVNQYATSFKIAQRLVEKGVSSNEIDRQVKVNDMLALQAMKHFSMHVIEYNDEYVLEKNQRINDTLNFINWIFLIIPLVLISGVLMFLLFHKIRKVNHRLEESHQFLSDLFEAAPDAMMIVDEAGIVTEANQQACNLFGFSREHLINKKVESLMPQRFRKNHKNTRTSSFDTTENRMLNNNLDLHALGKDDKEIPVEISLSYTARDNKKYAIVTLRDITEKKRIEENIKHLAQYDQLTDLPNRALLNDRLKHAIDRAKRNKSKIGLMFIDLDGFKKVNDSLGHQAGDDLLLVIAERLTNIVRSEDTVSRFGGDEFIILLEEIKHSDYAAIVAKKVLQAIGEVVYLSGHEVNVGASIGISIYPDNGNDVSNLIKAADISMYQAKKNGKNCYKFFIKDYMS